MQKLIFTAIILTFFLTAPAYGVGVDGSTTLKESVIHAVKQHPKVKSLLYNREAVSRTQRVALGRFFPSLTATSSVGVQSYNSETTRAKNRDDESWRASDNKLTLTQNVFDGMDRISDYDREKARMISAENRLFDTVETVSLDAIRAHINLVRERKLTILAGENITSHQELLTSIAERVAAGAGSKADEVQAQGRVARAESTFITYTGNLNTAEAQYIRMTGQQAGALEQADALDFTIPSSRDEVLDRAIEANPKIKISKAQIVIAEETKDIANSSMYPNVDLELSSRYTDYLDSSQSYAQDNRAMMAFTWNLLNGGSDYNQTKAAGARIDEAKAELQDTLDQLTRDVTASWIEYETAVRQIAKYQEALGYSIESRDMYLMQFNVGQRSLLDVLDSVNEVFTNSVLLETAKSNRVYTLYKLLELQGNLIKALEVADESYDTLSKQ